MDRIIPATPEHVRAVYGQPFRRTAIALAGVADDKTWGIGAIYPENGRMAMVFALTDEGRQDVKRHAKAILRGAKILLDKAAPYGMPIQTMADDYPRAKEMLKHLGFAPITETHYERRP